MPTAWYWSKGSNLTDTLETKAGQAVSLPLTPHAPKSSADWIASERPGVQAEFLNSLSNDALLALPYLFEFWAMEHQLPPDGDWRSWVILGGRGAGKTRAGAEWVRAQVEGSGPRDPGRSKRVALVAETMDQAREVMVFGESGLMACAPPDRRPEWQATRKRLVWPNGAVAQLFSAHDPDSLRGPQFDAAWVDEYGCAAIDKGTNQPNRFLDPKSSESGIPNYSNGRRDDLIQMQYLRAMGEFWADPANNPTSNLYDAPMVDMGHAHVWAWDARPYPYFPANTDLWSDGDNYAKGHWLTGRVTARALASVVAEICEAAGLSAYDVSGLYGVVSGYWVADVGTARAALQPLMLAHGFDAVERDGVLIFANRDGVADGAVAPETLAVSSDLTADVEYTRSAAPETAGRLRLNHIAADGSFETRTAEAVFPDEASTTVAQSELPLALTRVEAQAIVERWLAESRLARDTARFALPPSGLAFGAGDVVRLPEDSQTLWRIDRVEIGDTRLADATRVDRGLYTPSDSVEPAAQVTPFTPTLPVHPVFLDLPLMTGNEVPHAPHIAVAATPWPGSVAVYDNGTGTFELNRLITTAAGIGLTETPMFAAAPGVADRGAPLRIRMFGGALAAISDVQLLAGANALAIGDGASDAWEVFQFRDAVLVDTDTWEVSHRLRGQLGTDPLMPATWPSGSTIVVLNNALEQLEMPTSSRGLERTYRIGSASRSVESSTYVEQSRAFEGVGLRPYAPAHLRATRSGGDLALSWLRRTRIDGDLWSSGDVPLGETTEAYVLRVHNGFTQLREVSLTAPNWTYTAAMQAADAVVAPYFIEVAQVSERFGTGLFTRIEIDG